MAELTAPQQNRLLGQLANMLRATEGDIAAPEFLPSQLDVMGLVRQLMLPSAETVEKMSYGDPLFRMPMQSNIPITADREYLADIAGMIPFGAPAARPTARGIQDLVRQIQTEPPTGAISPEIAARVLPESITGSKIVRGEKPIQSAVVLVGDKIFTGQTHGQALNRAVYEGVVRKEGGKFIFPKDAEVNMDLFLTKDGEIIDRLQAYKMLDVGASESAIEKGMMQANPSRSMTVDEYMTEAEKVKSARNNEQMAGLLDQPAQSVAETSYRGSHSAPSRDFGAQLHQLDQIFPDDIYSPQAARLYGHYGANDPMDRQTIRLAQSFRGKPDADVTIYRAVPKDENIKGINQGDWVTINKQYAKEHGESVLLGDYKILEKKVKAKDIWTNADSIHEYGYDPD